MDTSELDTPEDAQMEADIAAAHFAPPATLQGQELWPMTDGSRYYYDTATEPADLRYYHDLAFCFVHLKRGGQTVHQDVLPLMAVLLNPATAHVAVMEWFDGLCGSDPARGRAIKAEAAALRQAALKLYEATEMEISYPETNNPKSSGATPPAQPITGSPGSASTSGTAPSMSAGNSPSGSATASTTPGTTATGPSAAAA